MATTENTTPVFSDAEIDAWRDDLRFACGSRPLSARARARYVGMDDGDLALDLARDFDADERES
jgi:hypothetical protein